jgi:hypothetical protein
VIIEIHIENHKTAYKISLCMLHASARQIMGVKPGIHDASFASKSPFKFLEFKFFDRVYHTRNLNGLGWNRNASYFFSTWMELGWRLTNQKTEFLSASIYIK